MDSANGSVLLDFSNGAVQWTQSGYRINDLVLTVASSSSGGLFQESIDGVDDVPNMSLTITCYQLDGPVLRPPENGRIRNKWMSKDINRIITEMHKSNLGPYIGNTKCTYNEATFLMIELNYKPGGSNNVNTALAALTNYSRSCNIFHGQDMYTVYTPFGANEFMNSCSKGCLSNRYKELLFLIDGRLAPGCEGAPVFTSAKARDQEYPVGLVLFPIAVGVDHSSYSLVAPMHTVLSTFLDSDLCQKPSSSISVLQENSPLQGAISNTVVVQTSVGWGSGIIISPGLVLTNSHVIGFGTKSCNPVSVFWKNRQVIAKVIYCSTASSVLDVALLEYKKTFGPNGITFSTKPLEKGETVVALGYPLHNLNMPSISKGVVLNCFERSVGFTTSCIINAGSSGGSIVREDGSLVGIVVGILKAGTNPYPEINICISSTLFENLLLSYKTTGDTVHWKALDTCNDPWLKALYSQLKCKY